MDNLDKEHKKDHNEKNKTVITNFDRTVIDLGIALAAVISYTNWHSIPWAILHGFLNRIYVIYFAIKY